jgi:hypothetical protein
LQVGELTNCGGAEEQSAQGEINERFDMACEAATLLRQRLKAVRGLADQQDAGLRAESGALEAEAKTLKRRDDDASHARTLEIAHAQRVNLARRPAVAHHQETSEAVAIAQFLETMGFDRREFPCLAQRASNGWAAKLDASAPGRPVDAVAIRRRATVVVAVEHLMLHGVRSDEAHRLAAEQHQRARNVWISPAKIRDWREDIDPKKHAGAVRAGALPDPNRPSSAGAKLGATAAELMQSAYDQKWPWIEDCYRRLAAAGAAERDGALKSVEWFYEASAGADLVPGKKSP